MDDKELLSIIIPCLNEESNIQPMYQRLHAVLAAMGCDYEIIFIDDGSRDGTFERISAVHALDPKVGGISFSRNFGHQAALLAGLQYARGALVVTMDGDLQHPPEAIPLLAEKFREGYDIVNTRRIDHQETGAFKKLSSGLFYRLMSYLSDTRVEPSGADFRLMGRKAVDAFLHFPERSRFTRGLVSWMGFRQAVVEYQAAARASGHTKYTLSRMARLALDAITSFSSRPLRISFYTGLLVSLLGMAYGLYIFFSFLSGKTIQGWASLMLTLLIIGGVVLINLGIVGEYIARIFNEVKGRPLYFIKAQAGLEPPQEKTNTHE